METDDAAEKTSFFKTIPVKNTLHDKPQIHLGPPASLQGGGGRNDDEREREREMLLWLGVGCQRGKARPD